MRYFLHPGLGGGIATDLEGDAFPGILGRPRFLCYSGEFPASKIPIFARNLKIGDISMKKILFLHGFFASGSCPMALALCDALEGRAQVLTPDLPMSPHDALSLIRSLCDREQPDLLVGNSCGAFYAQQVAPIVGIPALLGNPHFGMSRFLQERIGHCSYKSPRRDRHQELEITPELVEEFRSIEAHQCSCYNEYYRDKVWGLFGEQDTLCSYESLFRKYYGQSYRFPGHHTPSEGEVRTWYLPLIQKMLLTVPRSVPCQRYFQHFKGGKYRMERTAFDSETQQRMVVYQALYGNRDYWVRPEQMFFERIVREGREFNRFTEIDLE